MHPNRGVFDFAWFRITCLPNRCLLYHSILVWKWKEFGTVHMNVTYCYGFFAVIDLYREPTHFRARIWGSVLGWLVLGSGKPKDLDPSGHGPTGVGACVATLIEQHCGTTVIITSLKWRQLQLSARALSSPRVPAAGVLITTPGAQTAAATAVNGTCGSTCSISSRHRHLWQRYATTWTVQQLSAMGSWIAPPAAATDALCG